MPIQRCMSEKIVSEISHHDRVVQESKVRIEIGSSGAAAARWFTGPVVVVKMWPK